MKSIEKRLKTIEIHGKIMETIQINSKLMKCMEKHLKSLEIHKHMQICTLKNSTPPKVVLGEAGQVARDAYRDAYHLFTICGLETRWCIRDDFRARVGEKQINDAYYFYSKSQVGSSE